MRGVVPLVAALALAVTAAAAQPPLATNDHPSIDHIKAHILAKLGLSSRPSPVGAPPRDVVRRILAHADPQPEPPPHQDALREIIVIAHRE